MKYPKNPARSLILAEIAIDLEGVTNQSVFAMSIVSAVKDKSVCEAVKMIYEHILDNRNLVSNIIGEKIVKKIEFICCN